MVDCFLDSQRRTDLVLWLCPTRAPLNDCSRCNLALSNVRGRRRRWRCISQIEAEVRRLRQSWCDKRRGDERSGDSLLSQIACLFTELPRLLSYLALLSQSQNKRNESNRGMLDTRAQGAHEIPNTRSLLQQPTLEFSSGGAYRQ
jgi:hypothetical protein